MLEKTYQSMNRQIAAGPDLVADTIKRMEHAGTDGNRKNRSGFLRPVGAVLAVVLCLGLGTSVLAAEVPAIYELMYLVSPPVAQFFIPVRESCEDNGIRMEVVSTHIQGNTAEIYVTMQDLTGDRVDGTTDLFDSYSIHRSFDCSATCRRAGYDADTKTATFLIAIQEWGDHDITGSKLTFSVREFLSRKTVLEDVPVDFSINGVSTAPKTQTVDLTGWGGKGEPDNTALVPQGTLCTPAEGLDLTAIGVVNGQLHIQLKRSNSLSYDNHGYFYLVNSEGEAVRSSYSICFATDIGSDERVDYQEFVFDIPQKELADYVLYGSFYTSSLNTKGNWRVTFPLMAD